MRLVQEELLGLQTAARTVLGSDLPLIDDRVTVEHLLAHGVNRNRVARWNWNSLTSSEARLR